MRGSWKLLSVFGIDVRIHVTFGLILALAAIDFGHSHGLGGALFGAISIVALFACVTLHELGHSLVARRFGVQVREIVLYPIGGVARMLREPSRPLHELLIALAGPLVNVLIAVGLAFALAFGSTGLPHDVDWSAELETPGVRALLLWLLAGNVSLAVFNLLPALPMDGGRALRAILSFWLGRLRATSIAAGIGQFLALALVAGGILLPNLMLSVIGLFVFFGAGQEKHSSRASAILSELTAGEVCDARTEVLSPSDDLGDVLDHSLRSGHTIFPVVSGSGLVGLVLREDVMRAASRLGLRAPVTEVLRKQLPVCEPRTPLLEVRDRIADTGMPVVVIDDRQLLGILSAEDLSRISELCSRLATAGIRRPQRGEPEPSSAPRSAH